jgi:hypothetical protein
MRAPHSEHERLAVQPGAARAVFRSRNNPRPALTPCLHTPGSLEHGTLVGG